MEEWISLVVQKYTSGLSSDKIFKNGTYNYNYMGSACKCHFLKILSVDHAKILTWPIGLKSQL